jgi:hypothetical protein
LYRKTMEQYPLVWRSLAPLLLLWNLGRTNIVCLLSLTLYKLRKPCFSYISDHAVCRSMLKKWRAWLAVLNSTLLFEFFTVYYGYMVWRGYLNKRIARNSTELFPIIYLGLSIYNTSCINVIWYGAWLLSFP